MKSDTRSLLVEAATVLFARDGVAAARLESIAVMVGVTDMTLRRAFPAAPDKPHLELRQRIMSAVFDRAGAALKAHVDARLVALGLHPEKSDPVELVLAYAELVMSVVAPGGEPSPLDAGDDSALLKKQVQLLFGFDGAPQSLSTDAFEGSSLADLDLVETFLLRGARGNLRRARAVKCMLIGLLEEFVFEAAFPIGSSYKQDYDKDEVLSVLRSALFCVLPSGAAVTADSFGNRRVTLDKLQLLQQNLSECATELADVLETLKT